MVKKSGIPKGMQRVYGEFERWRKSQVGRPPIPERLWEAAVETAQEHRVFRTAKVLRLEYNKLRRLCDAADPGKRAAVAVKPPSPFVELVAPMPIGSLDCVIELEGPRGKLKIQWRGSTHRIWPA